MPTYTIYSITMSNGSYKYIGMTTQNLQKRLAQHKADAKSGSCSLSTKLCQRRKPRDLQVLHTKLKKNPNAFTIKALRTVTGSYQEAHKIEMSLKQIPEKLRFFIHLKKFCQKLGIPKYVFLE